MAATHGIFLRSIPSSSTLSIAVVDPDFAKRRDACEPRRIPAPNCRLVRGVMTLSIPQAHTQYWSGTEYAGFAVNNCGMVHIHGCDFQSYSPQLDDFSMDAIHGNTPAYAGLFVH